MINYVKQVLVGQFEASLAMLSQCVEACPPEQWEGRIANETCRWVAYHALFFTDLYLSSNENAFQLRELHQRGGDERQPIATLGLSQDEALAYVPLCRQKMLESIAAETEGSLSGPSGFSWYPVSRGELHLINIRHIQHHTGQLSAYVRRVDPLFGDGKRLKWIAGGWLVS
jgi:hypothetical protein